MSLIGNLEDLSLPDILQIVSLSRKSGILMLRQSRQQGTILIREGRVIQTVSPRPGRTVGELLVGRGLVRQDDLNRALEIQRSGGGHELLGTILVRLGLMDEASLEKIVQEQIEDAISFFLSWKEGTFSFELADIKSRGEFSVDPQAFILERGIDTQWLVLEGTRLIDEQSREREPRPPVEPQAAPPGETSFADLEAGPGPTVVTPPSVPPSAPPEPAPTAPADARLSRAEEALLRDMLQELQGPGAASEMGLLVLRFAAELLSRAVLFVVKGGKAVGLGGFGVEAVGGPGRRGIRGIAIPLDQPSLLAEVVARRATVQGPLEPTPWNRELLDQLGGKTPDDAVALPLVSGGRVRVILYGDNLPEKRPISGIRALETFLAEAGRTLEKALREKKQRG
jgi:hypothetical protein